jgi:alcohol dehydrogenase
MRAAIYREFGQPLTLETVPDPAPLDGGVVIEVKATGLCLSDWHGWMGHDPDISLPHVPGHELAGVVAGVGKDIFRCKVGDRVTLPFVCGCGTCPQCVSGNHQVCDHQFQPGFTHWGSFAEYVAINNADTNLVRLPDELDFISAASLGCRFVTAFRAIVAQGRISPGNWLAVHGCGGVGLSAIMIAHAMGANVVAIDISESKLALARDLGADVTLDATKTARVIGDVVDATGGGAHVSVDSLGSPVTCFNSIANLRKRGRHVQVGLMASGEHNVPVPVDMIISKELEIYGSHGMQAHKYPELLALIRSGRLSPKKLISKTIRLEESLQALVDMGQFKETGVTVITTF